MRMRGGRLAAHRRGSTRALPGLLTAVLALGLAAASASPAGATIYLQQNFTRTAADSSTYGGLLSEIPSSCGAECHWTRTAGADEAGEPIVFKTPTLVEGVAATTDPSATNFWHVQKGPQEVSVSPYILENLDTLGTDDTTSLPPAYGSGDQVAWFGDGESGTGTGTYCGSEAGVEAQDPAKSLNGCESSGTPEGELVSPPFEVKKGVSAYLRFETWWEIESQSPWERDLMAVDYSIDKGVKWTQAALLNPSLLTRPLEPAVHSYPYSNTGLQRAPEWTEEVVDLRKAAEESSELEVRFRFDARDPSYNGFRGWAVDDVTVTSEPPGTPKITSVIGCDIGAARTTVIVGENFTFGSGGEDSTLGATVELDHAPDGGELSESSKRIELLPLATGSHTLEVTGPNGTSEPFQFTQSECPPSPPKKEESSITTTKTTTTTTYPTTPPTERGHPAVDLRNGEIAAEFEFPEPGHADFVAVVSKGASLARVQTPGLVSLATPLATLQDLASAGAAKAKKCKKGYVRVSGKCVDNAPVGYGHASTTIAKAGRYRVIIKPSSRVSKALKKGKTLNVELTLTFNPANTNIHLIKATSVRVHLKLKR